MTLVPRLKTARRSNENKAVCSNSRALRGSLHSVSTAALSTAMQMAEAVIVQVVDTTDVVMPAPLAARSILPMPWSLSKCSRQIFQRTQLLLLGAKRGPQISPLHLYLAPTMTVDSQATATPIASSISVPCTQELDIELYGIDIVSGWNDIDANDSNDPLQASEYVDNTIEYLCERELVTMPNHAYMDRQKDLTWRMRHELVDWMVQIHYQLCLLPEALFLVKSSYPNPSLVLSG
ncbi:G2/mitotic-specific cyclin [Coemansia sp. S155-1]|nr:G2/mitotic-specific cyclin [Coemansia sp. S155-1]